MQDAALAVLLDHQRDGEIPTNGRFVFYELEGQGVVRKSEKGESRRGSADDPREQEVIDALIYLRDKEIIPWDWIEDETRHLYVWEHAPTVGAYVRERIAEARINPWPDEPPLILVESRSLGGPLWPAAPAGVRVPVSDRCDQRAGRRPSAKRGRADPARQRAIRPLSRRLGPPRAPDRGQHPSCSGTSDRSRDRLVSAGDHS
jgi:hypothetical protein